LTFFKELGLSLDERDLENSTPLHWASFAMATKSMYYLLGWKLDINAQDNSGNTALHISIKSADNLMELRSIKELLMKGADRGLRDN
jgi:ankyrin repeat protein